MADGSLEIESMIYGGCSDCKHFKSCTADAKAASGFSDTKTGRRCAGYFNSRTGETGVSSELFCDL